MEEEILLTIKVKKDVIIKSLDAIQERLNPVVMDESKLDKAMPNLIGIVGSDVLHNFRCSDSTIWIESGLEGVIKEYFKS